MQQSKLEFAILQYKSYQVSSGVALTVKAGRKPGKAVRKLSSIASQTAGGGVIVEEFANGAVHFRCPPGTRRAGKWTDRLGTDCGFGAPRVALNRIGEGIADLDRSLARRESRMRAGGPGTVKYSMGRAALSAADALDRMSERRESRRKNRKPGKVRTYLGERAIAAADALDARRDRRRRERMGDGSADVQLPRRKPLNEMTDEERDAYIQSLIGKPMDSPEMQDYIEQLTEQLNDDTGVGAKDFPSPTEITESIAVEQGSAKKMPGRAYGGAFKNRDNAEKRMVKLSEDFEDQNFHLVEDDKGRFRIVDDDRLGMFEDGPLATYRNGKNVDSPSAPTPQQQAASADVKKPKKLSGRQYGGAFKNRENAEKKARQLSKDNDEQMFVVEDDNGKFRIVDSDRLDSLGSDPIAEFTSGDAPGDNEKNIPDPVVVDADDELQELDDANNPDWGQQAWEAYMDDLEADSAEKPADGETPDGEKPETPEEPEELPVSADYDAAVNNAMVSLAEAEMLSLQGDEAGARAKTKRALAQLAIDIENGVHVTDGVESAEQLDILLGYRDSLLALQNGIPDPAEKTDIDSMLESLNKLSNTDTLSAITGSPFDFHDNNQLAQRREMISKMREMDLSDAQIQSLDEMEADLRKAEEAFALSFGSKYQDQLGDIIYKLQSPMFTDEQAEELLQLSQKALDLLRDPNVLEDNDDNDAFLANIERLVRRINIGAKRKKQGKTDLYLPDVNSTEVDERTQKLVSRNIDKFEELLPDWIEAFDLAGDAERAQILMAAEDQFLNIGHDMEVSDADLPRYNAMAQAIVALATEGKTNWKPQPKDIPDLDGGYLTVGDIGKLMDDNANLLDLSPGSGSGVFDGDVASSKLTDVSKSIDDAEKLLDTLVSNEDVMQMHLDSIGSEADPATLIEALEMNIADTKNRYIQDFVDDTQYWVDQLKKFRDGLDAEPTNEKKKELYDTQRSMTETAERYMREMVDGGADADDLLEAWDKLQAALGEDDDKAEVVADLPETPEAPTTQVDDAIPAAVGDVVEQGQMAPGSTSVTDFDYTLDYSESLDDFPSFKTSKKIEGKPEDMDDTEWDTTTTLLGVELIKSKDKFLDELEEELGGLLDEDSQSWDEAVLQDNRLQELAERAIAIRELNEDWSRANKIRSLLHDYTVLDNYSTNLDIGKDKWNSTDVFSKLSPRGQKKVGENLEQEWLDLDSFIGKTKKKPKIDLNPNESATDDAPLAQTQEGPIEFANLPEGSVLFEADNMSLIESKVSEDKWNIEGDTEPQVVLWKSGWDGDKYYILKRSAYDSMSDEEKAGFAIRGNFGGRKRIKDSESIGIGGFVPEKIFSADGPAAFGSTKEELINSGRVWSRFDQLRADPGSKPTFVWDNENNELLLVDGGAMAAYLDTAEPDELAKFNERMELIEPEAFYFTENGAPDEYGLARVEALRKAMGGEKQNIPGDEALSKEWEDLLNERIDTISKLSDPDADLSEVLDIKVKNNKLVDFYNSGMEANDDSTIEVEYQGALERISTALNMVAEIATEKGFDVNDLKPDQLKQIFDDSRFDSFSHADPFAEGYDKWIERLQRLVVARDAYSAELASRRMAELDAFEELEDIKNSNLPLTQLEKRVQEASDANTEAMARFNALRAELQSSSSSISSDKLAEFQQRRTDMLRAKKLADDLTLYRDAVKNEKFGDDKVPFLVNGEELAVPKADIGASAGTDLDKAKKMVDVYSDLKNEKHGIYKNDLGEYFIMSQEAGDKLNLEPVSISADGAPDPDATLASKAKSAPPLKKDYAGTENLGINNVDGEAIGQFVAVGDNGLADVETATTAVQSGESLANVPNRFLKESIWANTAGGGWTGDPDEARFELLSAASGFNNMGKEAKDQTQRFRDRTTGQTFVIKTATRNDQEGVRELVGNHFMGLMGMRTSGGRTADAPFTVENKFPSFHPEYDPEAEQVAILIESSEMLYDGTPLGHITGMSYADQQDVISRLTPESLASALVMDSHFRYYDRQNDNWIAVELPDGSVHYHPIDHGNAFGEFKQHKFHDKNGYKVSKGDNSPEKEDELGFMFTGLDGMGAWRLAQESMTTPERKRAFAEAVIRQVRRSESVDYEAEAVRVADAQHLSGKNRDRAVTVGKMMDGKKSRLDSYIDPMLKELGFSDDEIASIRASVDTPGAGSADVAKKSVIPSMVDATPIEGEEVFGGKPTYENARTFTAAMDEAAETPGKVGYVGMGGSAVVGPVQLRAHETNVDGQLGYSVSMKLDDAALDRLTTALDKGAFVDGSLTDVAVNNTGHQVPQAYKGKLAFIGDESITTATDLKGKAVLYGAGYGGDARTYMVKTDDGYSIFVHAGTGSQAYAMKGTVQVYKYGEKVSPDEMASVLSRLGVEPKYTDNVDLKIASASLIARTFDRGPKRASDPIAERLLRVAEEYGVTTSDVEVYYDSMGRMRMRLTEDVYEELAEKHGWNKVGAMVKTMSSKEGGENVVRLLTSGGIASKHDQVLGGSGLYDNAVEGGGGVGSGGSDLQIGGGLGVFMSVQHKDGTKTSTAWSFGSKGTTTVVVDPKPMMQDLGWWAYGPHDGPWGVLNPESSYMSSALGMNHSGGNVEPFDYVAAPATGHVFEHLTDGAVSMDHVSVIIVGKPSQKKNIIEALEAKGITEINGRPISEIVQTKSSKKKIRDLLPDGYTANNIWGISLGSEAGS